VAEISLKIKSDFEKAAADFKSLGALTESTQKQFAKLQAQMADGSIDKFMAKNKLNAAAMTATKGATAGLTSEMAGLQREMARMIKSGLDPMSPALDKMKARMSEIQKQLPVAASGFSGMMGTALKLGAVLGGAGIAYKLYDIGKASLQAAANMEQQKVAFSTMLGGAEKANVLLKEIQAFAESTPFSFNEVVDASKRMIAFGFSASEVIPKLRMVGDVAAGLSQPIGDMIYLFGQIKTQGKAMTQDLNQFANRGVPIFEEVAKAMGVPKEAVKKLAEEGKITYDVIEKAFQNMTGEGGKFGGLMEAQSKTLGGQWSNFNDQLDKTKVLLGDSLSKDAGNALGIMSELVKTYNVYLEAKSKQEAMEQKSAGFLEQMRANLEGIPEKIAKIKELEMWNYEDAQKYQDYLTGSVKLTGSEVEALKKKLELNRSISEIMKETVGTAKDQADIIGGEVGYMLRVVDALKKQQELTDAKGKTKTSTSTGGGQKKTELQQFQDLNKMKQTDASVKAEMLKAGDDYFAKKMEAEQIHGEDLAAWQEEQASLIANNRNLSFEEQIVSMDALSKAVKKRSQIDVENFAKTGAQIASNASSMFADLQTVMQNAGKSGKAFAIGLKIMSAAEAGINSFLAFTQVLRDPYIYPSWLRIPLAGTVLAAGLAKQAAILSTPIAETGLSNYTVPDIPAYRNDKAPVMANAGEQITVTPRGEESGGLTNINIAVSEQVIFSIVARGIKTGQINLNNKNVGRGVFAN